jgi:hypothetical protein
MLLNLCPMINLVATNPELIYESTNSLLEMWLFCLREINPLKGTYFQKKKQTYSISVQKLESCFEWNLKPISSFISAYNFTSPLNLRVLKELLRLYICASNYDIFKIFLKFD